MSSTAAPAARTGTIWDAIGIPRALRFGFIGVLIFMIGDGVESGLIAPFIEHSGAGSEVRASYVITAYGVTVMLASWLSGALSELWGPRRVMQIGLVVWIVLDALFLALGAAQGNYTLMLVFYGLRGFGYPLFAFSFLVWVTATAPVARLGAAVGWFYFAFTGGLPTLGSLTASITDPLLGTFGTLWVALVLIAVGGACCLIGVRERTGFSRLAAPGVRPVQSLTRSLSIAWTNPKVAAGCVVRVINTAPQFGLWVILPAFFTDEMGFTDGDWLRLLSIMFATNIFFNLLFGVVSDRIGWRTTIGWFGAVGCALSVLALYFVPKLMTGNYWVAVGVGMIYGVTLAGFVPISALMPSLAPGNKGGAMALLNLGAGGAAFVGPAIVSLFLGPLGRDGVVLIFAGLYVVAAVLTLFLQLPRVSQDAIQQGKNLHEAAEPLSAPAT